MTGWESEVAGLTPVLGIIFPPLQRVWCSLSSWMNGETISVLTRVSQAVNACVNLPAQTVLGLWSHRMADGEHSLLAAATLPFHNRPWCHVQTYGKPRRNIALLGQPDPLLTGHCVPPSPAPNIWCNWENCFIFLWKLCLRNPAKLCRLFLQCWALHMLKSAIIHPPHWPGKQCKFKHLLHKSKKSGGFPVVPDCTTLGYIHNLQLQVSSGLEVAWRPLEEARAQPADMTLE